MINLNQGGYKESILVKKAPLQDGQAKRNILMQEWLLDVFSQPAHAINTLRGDASARRYFRVWVNDQSYIVMDSDPEYASNQAFISIARCFALHEILVPKIYAKDTTLGFLLLSDFGDRLLLNTLNNKTVDGFYSRAMDTLFRISGCVDDDTFHFPHFSKNRYEAECELFTEWYLQKYLGIALSRNDYRHLSDIFSLLIDNIISQPRVCVHRDYHSRNLMVLPDNRIGVLDFQDAFIGPVTYDLISLIRDCYIDWPKEWVTVWMRKFQKQAIENGLFQEVNPCVFKLWCDYMSLERHLKCLGTFARLYLRDNKSEYIDNMPRIIGYIKMVINQYPEFRGLDKYF